MSALEGDLFIGRKNIVCIFKRSFLKTILNKCHRPIFPCLLNICETLNAFFSKQYLDDIGPFSYAMLCLMMLVSCNNTVHIL